MPTTFHILDAIAQDVDGEALVKNGYASDDDPEIRPARGFKGRKPAGGAAAGDEAPKNPANLHFNIYLFGKTAEGTPLRVRVEGFQPFFYVRLPEGRKSETKAEFRRSLDDALKRKSWLRDVVVPTFVERKVLYGYTGGKTFTFAQLTVPSLTAFRALRRLFLDPEVSKPIFCLKGTKTPLEVYEANLDPMLRFFHLRDIKPCGWVTMEGETEDGELEVPWEEVHPATGPVAAAPFLMAAWDIECYSENGEFTLAKKGYDRLAKQLYALAETPQEAARLIMNAATGSPDEGMDHLRHRNTLDEEVLRAALDSDVFTEGLTPLLMKKEGLSAPTRDDRIRGISSILAGTIKRALPLAGDPIIQIGTVLVVNGAVTERHIFVYHPDGTCDPVPGAVLHRYRTEKGLILGWAKAIAQWNPDILMGYNVFGYDERYLWERSEELGITLDPAIQSLSRMVDMDKGLELEKKFLSSSAMGDNTLYMWTAHGRLKVTSSTM